MVPRVRFELTRPKGHCPLKTACLPFHHLGPERKWYEPRWLCGKPHEGRETGDIDSYWQGRQDSNPRPVDLEATALPAELHPCAKDQRSKKVERRKAAKPARVERRSSKQGRELSQPRSSLEVRSSSFVQAARGWEARLPQAGHTGTREARVVWPKLNFARQRSHSRRSNILPSANFRSQRGLRMVCSATVLLLCGITAGDSRERIGNCSHCRPHSA